MLALLSSLALAAPRTGCATPALLPFAPPLRTEPVPARLTGKGSRDPYGLPNLLESANFVVRWGDGAGIDPADIARLSDAFELAWAVQIDTMDHPAPYGTDGYRFNVYIGDSGSGAPDDLGAAGYYYPDPEGWPMVVVAAITLDIPENADNTAAHEFYHAIQDTTARYVYDGVSAWYWEATAEWAANETLPWNAYLGSFLFGYLLLPELPVNFFDYPDSGALQEYHQYGAFLFPYDLTRTVDWELIRDSWSDTGTEPDPLEVQRAWLAERGLDFDELWLDHLGHNAAYDYPHGESYAASVAAMAPYFPEAVPILQRVPRTGGEGDVAGAEAPRRYGSSTIALDAPVDGVLTVTIEGDEAGSEGSPARIGARIVRVFDAGARIEQVPVPFDGPRGSLVLDGVGDEDTIWLTVGTWTPEWSADRWITEGFGYRWTLAVDPVEGTGTDTAEPIEPPVDSVPPAGSPDAADGPEGCGCASRPGANVSVALLLVLAARARRRRGSAPSPASR